MKLVSKWKATALQKRQTPENMHSSTKPILSLTWKASQVTIKTEFQSQIKDKERAVLTRKCQTIHSVTRRQIAERQALFEQIDTCLNDCRVESEPFSYFVLADRNRLETTTLKMVKTLRNKLTVFNSNISNKHTSKQHWKEKSMWVHNSKVMKIFVVMTSKWPLNQPEPDYLKKYSSCPFNLNLLT